MFHRLPTAHRKHQLTFIPGEALSPGHAAIHHAVERSYDDFVQLMELSHDKGAELFETLTDYQVKLSEHKQKHTADAGSEPNVRHRNLLKHQLDTRMGQLLGAELHLHFENYRIGLLLKHP